jgi:hypothetical protein
MLPEAGLRAGKSEVSPARFSAFKPTKILRRFNPDCHPPQADETFVTERKTWAGDDPQKVTSISSE